MATLNPYLVFNGNTREAMEFYHKALGGKLNIMPFGEFNQDIPKERANLVMHAHLQTTTMTLMASDSQPNEPSKHGDNVTLMLYFDDTEEQKKLFDALAEGGKIVMPLQDTFWNAIYGQLVDKFGIIWQFNYDKP